LYLVAARRSVSKPASGQRQCGTHGIKKTTGVSITTEASENNARSRNANVDFPPIYAMKLPILLTNSSKSSVKGSVSSNTLTFSDKLKSREENGCPCMIFHCPAAM
jgi:hypothetical protein